MTRRERVVAALRHQETDIIPYHIDFTHQEQEKVAAYLGDQDFVSSIGNHISSAYFSGNPEELAEKPGYFIDEFGVVWNRTGADKDIGVLDNILFQEPDMGNYKFPEIRKEELCREYEKILENKDEQFTFASIGFSMFERAWSMRGMANFLSDMLLEPTFAEELLDGICDYNIQIIDLALSYDGFDGFHFGDDWGQQRGLIMGPDLWRKFIKPRMKRMYERVKSKGKFVSQHSCGDIQEIFPDLIEIGLDVYQTFQPEIYDIEAVKKEYGNDLSFWGGISTQRLLPFATPQEVQRKTIEIMRILGKGGGYIASPTHAIPGDVPPENVEALIDVFQNQQRYL